jgi:3-oxoacid CoA-transferase B subunit
VDSRELIAKRAAKELFDGAVVNLGFGIPVLVAKYIDKRVILFGENGIIGYGFGDTRDLELIDGGTNWASLKPGISFVDSATAFGIVRGGHVDIAILGALQVSEAGDLANWSFGNGVGGVGGAVDMAVGARKVVAVMEHVNKSGKSKVVKKCSFPITAARCVNLVVTDMAVIAVAGDGMVVIELLDGHSFEDVQKVTDVPLRC